MLFGNDRRVDKKCFHDCPLTEKISLEGTIELGHPNQQVSREENTK